MVSGPPSERTQLKRHPERGRFDRETIHAILDEGLVCHVAAVLEGRPIAVPMTYARDGDFLLLHAASSSRIARLLAGGAECCVVVTILDGLVLARSAFDHSMNYRSVVIFGRPEPIEGADAKLAGLRALVEHITPGRWSELRPVHESELLATTLLRLSLDEASAKIRSGPPQDDENDLGFPVWAGVVPLALTASAPEDDPKLLPGQSPPASILPYRRRQA